MEVETGLQVIIMVWKLAKGYSMNAVKVSLVTIHVYHSGKHS